MNPRMRWMLVALGLFIAVALLAWVQYGASAHITADKVTQYANATDLTNLSGPARLDALRQLEDMINRLSPEERRKWRLEGAWEKWLSEMTENEKGQFMDATMPSGFTQFLDKFDKLPPDQRKKYLDMLDDYLKKNHQLLTDREPGETNSMYGTNLPPQLSAQLVKRAYTLGLKTFYTESSAETKAEVAPFLEGLQHDMQRPIPVTPAP